MRKFAEVCLVYPVFASLSTWIKNVFSFCNFCRICYFWATTNFGIFMLEKILMTFLHSLLDVFSFVNFLIETSNEISLSVIDLMTRSVPSMSNH